MGHRTEEKKVANCPLITYGNVVAHYDNSNLLVKKFLLSGDCEAYAHSKILNDFLRIPSVYIKKMVNSESENLEAFFELPNKSW